MRSQVQIVLSVLLVCCLGNILASRGADVQAKHDPVLRKIGDNIKVLFQKEQIEPKFSWDEDSLNVSLDTQKFMVHGSSMTGEFSEKATE